MNHRLFGFLVILLFLYIASPLLLPLAMGGVLAVLFFPLLEKLEKKGVARWIGSFFLTLGITVVLIFPASVLIFSLARSGFNQLQVWKGTPAVGTGFMETVLNIPKVHGFMVLVTEIIPIEMTELTSVFQELAISFGSKITELMGEVFTHLPGIAVSLTIVVVSINFFLVDGKKLVLFLRHNSVFSPRQTDQLLDTLAEMCRSVILAAVVAGVAQAILESLVCMITGTPNVAFVALLVFFGSFIPLIGAVPITLWIAMDQFFEGNQTGGIILLIMVFVLMGVDNMIRPWFLKGKTDLHPLLTFVAAFGGLQTIGFLGVFLGPIIAALFVVTIRILTQRTENC